MKRYLLLMFCLVLAGSARGQSGDRYALLIGGLGGSDEHTERFQQYLFDTRKALVETHGFEAGNVVVLGETKLQNLDFIDGVSLEETIRAEFGKLAGRVTTDDHVYVILYGHGGFDGTEARFNIPRTDLTQGQYAELVGTLGAGRVIFINTASASAPFVEAISGPGRIVITATRVGSQKNETYFPGFLVDGLASPAADRDKNGSLSVGEWFSYAAEMTDQWFTDNGNIPTENALIDDDGDGKGTRLNELEGAADGNLAGLTYLSRRDAMLAASVGTVSAGWLREKEQIEQSIAEVKSRKSTMGEEAYYAELETLFVRLARGNDAAEQGQ